MRIEALGDAAYVLRDLADLPAYEWARRIEGLGHPGVIEVTPAFGTVGVYVDPFGFDSDAFAARLSGLESEPWTEPDGTRTHTIPTCYELGDDLEEAASHLQLTCDEVAAAHASETYVCHAIGFCPGFPYLGSLPPSLRGVPRRPVPRVRVEPGSVAITGDQTGVYPLPRPGGWALIGRTPLLLVSVEEDYFPIAPGDHVRFAPISTEEYRERLGERL
ncbi:MAG: carboxyltransferase domain-containing protein [Fimbriimonadaceae bacterium]|nr:carboxyltransferase domain-containing protein [Fimbriimonadaceae bacterium]